MICDAAQHVLTVLDKMTQKDLFRKDLPLFKGLPPHSGTDICMRAYMHTAHHRGQAIVYLRVKGITPPTWKFEPRGTYKTSGPCEWSAGRGKVRTDLMRLTHFRIMRWSAS
jgi:hypothetical protein